jgi:hypothetical protein
MLLFLVHKYYEFFDETLESTTFVVLFITLIIFFVGTFVPNIDVEDIKFMRTSIFDANMHDAYSNKILIDGVEYKVNFEKLDK